MPTSPNGCWSESSVSWHHVNACCCRTCRSAVCKNYSKICLLLFWKQKPTTPLNCWNKSHTLQLGKLSSSKKTSTVCSLGSLKLESLAFGSRKLVSWKTRMLPSERRPDSLTGFWVPPDPEVPCISIGHLNEKQRNNPCIARKTQIWKQYIQRCKSTPPHQRCWFWVPPHLRTRRRRERPGGTISWVHLKQARVGLPGEGLTWAVLFRSLYFKVIIYINRERRFSFFEIGDNRSKNIAQLPTGGGLNVSEDTKRFQLLLRL